MNYRWWLRLEGGAELAMACWLFSRLGASWLLFAVLFLVPDASMLGYLAGTYIGAWCYNIAHNYLLPLALVVAGVVLGGHWVVAVAIIWCAHISFDRMLGYGLKSAESFQSTHLGRIGRSKHAGGESDYPESLV
jgi:hypothetical protein